MQRCNENVHFLTLFCHLILVIFTLTSWHISLVFQLILIILTANLCSLVKWCTSDAFKRYNIVILFFGDFCVLTSWRPNSAPWWNGAPLMPWFKPQTYSSAAELPQIAQSKLFKFQFGGNVKFENKINTKRTLFSCVRTRCQILCTVRLQCVSKILTPRRML